MRTKSYLALGLGPLAIGGAFAPSNVSASLLLAGFHDFDNGTTSEVADYLNPQIASAAVTKTFASYTGGGDSDLTYGLADFSSLNPAANNGVLRRDFTLSVTNGSLSTFVLENLYFDTVTVRNETVTVTYGSNTFGPVTPLPVKSGTGATTEQNFSDYVIDLMGITFAPGQIITFNFQDSLNGARFDNIALSGDFSPVPEPGSFLALGGLMGAGALFRARSRRA